MSDAAKYTPEEARRLSLATGKRGKNVCPHCGHPMLDDMRQAMRGKQKAIFEVVARAGTLGISTSEIMEVVYANRADGGPTWNVVANNILFINKKIADWGLVIRSHRGGGQSCYRLLPLEGAE